MQLSIKQLSAHVQKPLAPLYLLSSDVPLLLQEARDTLRQAAKQQGATEYELLCLEPGFDWKYFNQLTQNLSLFSDKTIIDLRNPHAKFDDKGLDYILHYCANPSPHHILLISMPKLTQTQQQAKWFKAIDKAGVMLVIWPPFANELPNWVSQRLKRAQLSATPEAISLLLDMTAGNLLATQQTIDKLALLFNANHCLTPDELWQALADNARYSVFDLTQATLLGQHQQIVRIMQHLPPLGVEPPLVLWALTHELRELINAHYQIQQGVALAQILAKQRPMRKNMLQVALKRSNLDLLRQALQFGEHIDGMIKGANPTAVWPALTEMALMIAGKKLCLYSVDY